MRSPLPKELSTLHRSSTNIVATSSSQKSFRGLSCKRLTHTNGTVDTSEVKSGP